MVQPGVDDEPDGAEVLGLQPAQVVERVVLVPHLPGEALGVEGPALREGREGQHSAEGRDVAQLRLDTDLEVMTRDALVIGERPHGPARRDGGELGEEDRRPRAVEACGVVVARGRVLAVLGDAPHLDGRPRDEVERRPDPRADLVDDVLVLGDQLFLCAGRVRAQETLFAGEPPHQLCEGRVRVALRCEDAGHLCLDARHLGEAQLVDLLGAHVGRGARADAVLVVGVAVGELPDTRVVGRLGLERLEERDRAIVGGIHGAADELDGLLLEIVPSGLRHLVEAVESIAERGHEERLRGGDVANVVKVPEDLRDDESRRCDPLLGLELRHVELLEQLGPDGREPAQVVARAARVRDPVHPAHEVDDVEVGAAVLADRVVVQLEALARYQVGEEPLEHVVGEPILPGDGVAVVAA